jgi:thiol-disulfide isomerase/thioredoxin
MANSQQQLETVLAQNKGSVIYLDFWASWCVPCRKSFPWLNHLKAKYGENNFKVISVNVDEEHDLALKFLEKSPAHFPVIYDPEGEIASKYKLKGMPSSFLINQQGEIVTSHVGFYEDKKGECEQEIKNLIKAQS